MNKNKNTRSTNATGAGQRKTGMQVMKELKEQHRESGSGLGRAHLNNRIALGVLWGATIITIGLLAVILIYVAYHGLGVVLQDFPRFIFTWPEGVNAEGGIWPTIVATLYSTGLAMAISTPIAVLAAVYLAEYAKQGRIVKTIRFAADSLASVPSIVMGLFGLAFFVETLNIPLSMLAASLGLSLLMLPITMRATEEAIRAVPRYIRWGSYGMGATKWQTVSRVVLPTATPRIITGLILSLARAIGETAVVFLTMGIAINLPIIPTDSGRSMSVHLYLMAVEGINLPSAYGTAFLLLLIILVLNLSARYISKRYSRIDNA
ncbi:MAG: phosphate ABC transporter permease PstA [Coriobacteriia bacterium]|nr:phosphate ABC transporter permease PstA [Coriobacteriia bacterium]MCL2870946.1 phosphate ABC transporter permease PstA [Coriobacteriia bacterium]